ncbi:MAG TPA: hypothetical protein VFY40_26745 [Blastocatellia bacterium]|nr:hypothetical protein [Blastocatellia bacterium]
MAETLSFNTLFQYDTRRSGITLPVRLEWGGKRTEFKAKFDSGSSACIFARNYGEDLELDIENGSPQRFETVTGGFLTYGHEVTLTTPGVDLITTVYFAADDAYSRNVLGRQGWLDRIRLGLIDYEGKLYLSDYNGPA